MSYTINAWLDEGAPRLRLIDSHSGTTALAWDFPAPQSGQETLYRQEMQKLFRQLLLLACIDEQTPADGCSPVSASP